MHTALIETTIISAAMHLVEAHNSSIVQQFFFIHDQPCDQPCDTIDETIVLLLNKKRDYFWIYNNGKCNGIII